MWLEKKSNATIEEPGAYFVPTDREHWRLVSVHRLSLRLTIRSYFINPHLYSIHVCERTNKRKRLTLLSQLPTARKSATGQKEREDMESTGGSATSTSLSPVEETFADVEFAPKKAIGSVPLCNVRALYPKLPSKGCVI
jgi:hypothetical protein